MPGHPDGLARRPGRAGGARCRLQRDLPAEQEELPYVGRTGELGDDSGSRIIAARLARGIVHLGFLLERRWAPYPKWAGVAFGRTPISGALAPLVARVLSAGTWEEREAEFASALSALASAQVARGLPVAEPAVVPFHDRPTKVVNPALIAALVAAVRTRCCGACRPGSGRSSSGWTTWTSCPTLGGGSPPGRPIGHSWLPPTPARRSPARRLTACRPNRSAPPRPGPGLPGGVYAGGWNVSRKVVNVSWLASQLAAGVWK